jgi:DNA polymerase III delta subunit
VDYAAFLRHAEHGHLEPVLLVHGADPQLLDDAATAATRALFPSVAEAALGREVFDGREATLDTIVRSAMTLPLLAGTRLVVVRRAQALASKGGEALAAYAADPNPSARLLLLADEPLAAGRERKSDHWLLQALPAAAIVLLPGRRGRALEEWLRQRAGVEGLTVSEEASRLLVQWVGDDSATLLGEVRKAALAGGPDNHAVGVREVTAIVGEHRLSGVFDLTRAVERGETGLALKTLDRLLATEEPLLLLALLVRELRTAVSVRHLKSRGQSTEQIARALRRPPGAVEAIAAAAAGASAEVVAGKLERCWEVERRLKSGGEPRAEMAALVAELCSR